MVNVLESVVIFCRISELHDSDERKEIPIVLNGFEVVVEFWTISILGIEYGYALAGYNCNTRSDAKHIRRRDKFLCIVIVSV